MSDDFGKWGDGLPGGPAPIANDDEWGDGLPLGPSGGSGPTPVPEAGDFIFEILIGGEVVWSALNALPQQGLQIDTSRFTGTQQLVFRIRGLP